MIFLPVKPESPSGPPIRPASGIDQVSRLGINPLGWDYLPDDTLNDCLPNFFMFNVGCVLGGDHDSIDPDRTKPIVLYRT